MVAAPDLEHIAAIAEELPLGIWVAGVPEGQLIYANRAFEDILGMRARTDVEAGSYSAAYAIHRRGAGPYPEAELPYSRALATRSTVTVDDIDVVRPDGSTVAVRATAKPLFAPDGALRWIAVVFSDITREVEADLARTQAEDRLRRVVDMAPLILFALDARGTITLSEGRTLQRIGFQPGELVGRSVYELYVDQPGYLANLRRVYAGESFVVTDDVGGTVLQTSFSPMREDDGEVTGVVGIALDITKQKKMERQLLHADRMAAVGAIAAGVAHEINNPLTYVMASLAIVEQELKALGPSAANALDHLARARDGVDRVGKISRDLLTFARESADRAAPVDLTTPARAAVRMSAKQTSTRARVIEEYGETPLVLADEGRLAQLFLNLLLNAAQAIPEGDPSHQTIRIRTSTAGDGAAVCEVSDTGSGIPEAYLGNIFEPFFTTKPPDLGSGLGLSVSKGIVESFGGTLTARSELGKGSTFEVRLPACDALPPSPEPAREHPRARPGARRRILLIDDDVHLGKVFHAVVGAEHEITVLTRGHDALELLGSGERFDLILCDVMLGDIEARTLHDELRARRPGLERELVFITGGAYSHGAREFLRTVANPCIEKPFDIRSVVDRLLARP